MKSELSRHDIMRLFNLLNDELARSKSKGELYVVGGAVMCLVFDARQSTLDVDALFQPTSVIRNAAARIAAKYTMNEHWLNDAVKGYLSPNGAYDSYVELSHLNVFTAQAPYLLAMKCLAARIGEEFHDINDIRYLLRYLNIETYTDARTIIAQYYPVERFPQKTLYMLEELLTR